MPHPIVAAAQHLTQLLRGAIPTRWSPPVPSVARWTAARAAAWQCQTGWLVGCNFTPSTACNQLEMWQAATFDPETIDRELGWAHDLGFNSVRVFLHDLLWQADREAFLDRIDEYLAIADRHRISTMFVLFDGVWNPHPTLGPQPEPKPGVHNSRWVQGPGAEILADPARWPSLRPYVDAVLSRFGDDARVVVWDLFNEPDQPNAISYCRTDIAHKSRLVDGLLNQLFDWAQEADPTQPLTAGVFMGVSGAVERVGRVNRTMLARSDVLSFHSYAAEKRLVAAIRHLGRYRRPLLCTEWLARPMGSTIELLEVFKAHDVSAYNWGLVEGRTQTRHSWTTWIRRDAAADELWFHDLLHADGRPYRSSEADLVHRVIGGGSAR